MIKITKITPTKLENNDFYVNNKLNLKNKLIYQSDVKKKSDCQSDVKRVAIPVKSILKRNKVNDVKTRSINLNNTRNHKKIAILLQSIRLNGNISEWFQTKHETHTDIFDNKEDLTNTLNYLIKEKYIKKYENRFFVDVNFD